MIFFTFLKGFTVILQRFKDTFPDKEIKLIE